MWIMHEVDLGKLKCIVSDDEVDLYVDMCAAIVMQWIWFSFKYIAILMQ
jgi:hypothetical protein